MDPRSLDPATPWLDEVRTQRQAWEARRDESRSAFEARRRAYNPRGAAKHEAWEEEIQRRRAARHDRLEHERAYFWDLGPGPDAPPRPWPEPSGPPSPESLEPRIPSRPPAEGPELAPQGWDNLWYFRGF